MPVPLSQAFFDSADFLLIFTLFMSGFNINGEYGKNYSINIKKSALLQIQEDPGALQSRVGRRLVSAASCK